MLCFTAEQILYQQPRNFIRQWAKAIILFNSRISVFFLFVFFKFSQLNPEKPQITDLGFGLGPRHHSPLDSVRRKKKKNSRYSNILSLDLISVSSLRRAYE